MNTNYTVFEAPKVTPVVPSPSPPTPQVVVVQSASRATFAAFVASVLAIFSIGCDVGQYIANHRPTPAPAPIPAPLPPKPSPLPPTPAPAPITDALTVILIYDPTAATDNQATAAIRADASLPGRLKSANATWYLLSASDAAANGFTPAMAGKKTPLIGIQRKSDPTNTLTVYDAPATSDAVVALVSQYRGAK